MAQHQFLHRGTESSHRYSGSKKLENGNQPLVNKPMVLAAKLIERFGLSGKYGIGREIMTDNSTVLILLEPKQCGWILAANRDLKCAILVGLHPQFSSGPRKFLKFNSHFRRRVVVDSPRDSAHWTGPETDLPHRFLSAKVDGPLSA